LRFSRSFVDMLTSIINKTIVFISLRFMVKVMSFAPKKIVNEEAVSEFHVNKAAAFGNGRYSMYEDVSCLFVMGLNCSPFKELCGVICEDLIQICIIVCV